MSDYLDKIDKLLSEYTTKDGFELWNIIKEKTPMVFHRPSSSSGKYHKKDSGEVRTIGEHTYQIIFSATKIMKIFGINLNTKSSDVILLSAACHDLFKYGCEDALHRKNTDSKHDKLIADTIMFNKDRLLHYLNEGEVKKLEQITRYHTGKWSTDANEKTFNFSTLPMEVLFIHILDVLSAENLLKIPEIENVITKNNSDS